MHDFLFHLFALMTLVSAGLVVFNPFSKSTVTSAMFLVLTMLWMAGLFVLLNAFFLAAVQVLVYAGAVIVLFIFVIMLLQPEDDRRARFPGVASVGALIAVGGFGFATLRAIHQGGLTPAGEPVLQGSTAALGRALFSGYLLPFEAVSVLLLVAMLGVILLSQKEPK